MVYQCNNFPKYSFEQIAQIKKEQKKYEKYQNTCMILNMANNAASMALNAFFSNCYTKNNSYSLTSSTPVNKTNDNQIKDDNENLEDAVKKLLGEDIFNNLSEKLKDDVTSKYEVLKNIRKLDEETLKYRLKNYINVTQNTEQKNSVKAFVTEVLQEAGKTVDENILSEIIDKHNLIELFDPSDSGSKELLKQRILDYTNSLDYTTAQLKFNQGSGQEFKHSAINAAIEAKDLEAFKQGFIQFGRETVEQYDSINPNGVINFEEFAAYQAALNGVTALDDTHLAILKTEFDILDVDLNGTISKEEMATDLWVTSVINDKKDGCNTAGNITQEEYNAIQKGKEAYITLIAITGMTKAELKANPEILAEAKKNLSAEEQVNLDKYLSCLKNGIEAFLK